MEMHCKAQKQKAFLVSSNFLHSNYHMCYVVITLQDKRFMLISATLFQVIQGYERGVPGMCLGETRTLTVPPHLAYGAHGIAGIVIETHV